LDSLVAEFVSANENRDKQGLQEFINLKLGEPWDDNLTSEDVGAIVHRRREYYAGEMPIPVCLLTAGVDVQRDRLECTIIGWGAGCESWVLRHEIIMGDPLNNDVWAELDAVIMRPYKHELFGPMQIMCACVDSGDGLLTESVYKYTKPREARRIFSSKGRGGDGVPLVARPNRVGRYKAILYILGVDAGKSIVTSRLQLQDEGPGYVHVPRDTEKGCGKEYCMQLGAERLVQKFERGKTIRKWTKVRERNEALDCMVMATAALQILGVNMDEYARMMVENGGRPAPKRPKRAKGKSVF
jgi:phage terminase large subunit GpA-like protein